MTDDPEHIGKVTICREVCLAQIHLLHNFVVLLGHKPIRTISIASENIQIYFMIIFEIIFCSFSHSLKLGSVVKLIS